MTPSDVPPMCGHSDPIHTYWVVVYGSLHGRFDKSFATLDLARAYVQATREFDSRVVMEIWRVEMHREE